MTHCSEKASVISQTSQPNPAAMNGTSAGKDIRKDDDTSRIRAVMTTIIQA